MSVCTSEASMHIQQTVLFRRESSKRRMDAHVLCVNRSMCAMCVFADQGASLPG